MNVYPDHPERNDVSPFYHLVGPYNARIQEYEMSQNIIAPAAWMMAIMEHKPATVIEIGTCKGGMAALLSSCTASYGGEFHTMDVRSGGDTAQYPLYGKAKFYHWNCFNAVQMIRELIQLPGLTFLLCDGGDKPMEFNTFAPFLKPGDVIAAHDWIDETIPDYSPRFWGICELNKHKIDMTLKLEKLDDFRPELFKYSAWLVKQKRHGT